MKTKTQKPLSWKPVLRGEIYCSPACGSDCTRLAFDKANAEAMAVSARLKTHGWRIRVWENMGWHWCLTNTLCGLSLHTSGPYYAKGTRKYFCMIATGSERNVSHGSCETRTNLYHANPNKVIADAIILASRWYDYQAKGYQNLKLIL